jgi:hypothetical protein
MACLNKSPTLCLLLEIPPSSTSTMPLTDLHFDISPSLADQMGDLGVKHMCYERRPGDDSQFDSMVNGYSVHAYHDNAPFTTNVLNMDQTSTHIMRATHVIQLFQNHVAGKQVGSVFLRYSNINVYKISTPPSFTILLVLVNQDMRRRGYGSLLMRLAYELSKELATKNPLIRKEFSEEFNCTCTYHLVSFVPIYDER